jgi:hypothetical protein
MAGLDTLKSVGKEYKDSLLGIVEKARLTVKKSDDTAPLGSLGEGHTLNVQFNPSTLRIDANTDSMDAEYMMNNMTKLPNKMTRSASIVLHVELIFDEVNVRDAFFADKFRVSASDAASFVGNAIASEIKGESAAYSVLPQTNAMIALLTQYTPEVTFSWGKLSFRGLVHEITAQYLMFSMSGRPIRSKVSMRIVQEISDRDKSSWETAFTSFFDDKTVLAQHESKMLQKQGLLNFDF